MAAFAGAWPLSDADRSLTLPDSCGILIGFFGIVTLLSRAREQSERERESESDKSERE